MNATILDGKALASRIAQDTSQRAATFLEQNGRMPSLALVSATDDPASASYVRSLVRAASSTGIDASLVRIDAATPEEFADRLATLAAEETVSAVLLQTPLPNGFALSEVASSIPWQKDVDGASVESSGRLSTGREAHPPATAQAVIRLLVDNGIAMDGQHVVVVGRSPVVGMPVARLLVAQDATVTICHSRSRDLPGLCAQADILVVAAGRPGLVGRSHVRPGATVIDVGTNFVDGKLCGDVAFDEVRTVAGAISPVPGGVGPVTTQLLMSHTVDAALWAQALR